MDDVSEKIVVQYMSYVDEMIKAHRQIGDIINEKNEVTPQRINTALALYYKVHTTVIAEYQRQKIKYEAKALEYKAWEDERFQEAKKVVIDSYEEKKIKPSITEFQVQLRLSNKEEYQKRNLELIELEARMRFMLRLLEGLNRYDSILTTMSYNSRSEMKSLSLDERMNASPEGVYKNRIRSRVPINK